MSGNAGERAFNNFLNPAYTSEIETSAMEEELLRLYRSTGEGGVLPSGGLRRKSQPTRAARPHQREPRLR